MFEHGATYTREAIHAQVGGSLQSYLPHVGDRIVAACLRTDVNPDAPAIILVGDGDEVERAAEMLTGQRTSVPTFLKRETKEWEYVGEFVADSWSRDPGEISVQRQRSGRRTITMVIHMVPART
jgi:hypothetical protein